MNPAAGLGIGIMPVKAPVRLGSTADLPLAGLANVDGVAPVAGDRILVKNQIAQQDNGIYAADVGAWARTTDANNDQEVKAGILVVVTEGATQNDTEWEIETPDPIVVGTTPLSFIPFAGSSSAVPQPISGVVGAPGVGPRFAFQDHVHFHANLAGGALHDLVTPNPGGVAGFESPADKAAFDANTSKLGVRLASTGNLALNGLAASDGVVPVAGDRVLAKDQTTGADNGIYLAAAGAWTRSTPTQARRS